jgi:hypothetical protein
MTAVRLGQGLTDLFAVGGLDALTRFYAASAKTSFDLVASRPSTTRMISLGRRPLPAEHARTGSVAIDAIGSVTKSGLHDPKFEAVIPGRRRPGIAC